MGDRMRVRFLLQATASFPAGAPDRCEYETDDAHELACGRYAAEWRREYECPGCKASDFPQCSPREPRQRCKPPGDVAP